MESAFFHASHFPPRWSIPELKHLRRFALNAPDFAAGNFKATKTLPLRVTSFLAWLLLRVAAQPP
jgi:hypothetical protein